MMETIVLFFSFFSPLTIIFYLFVTYQTKKEEKEQEPFYIKVIVSLGLSFIVTLVLMFFVFIVLGSASFTNYIFNLGADLKKLVLISVTIVGYSIVIDHFVFNTIKYIVGNGKILLAAVSLIRFLIFFLITSFFSLEYNVIFILTLLFVVLFLLVDIYNLTSKKVKS
jgi:hypothetical protein